MELPRNYLRKHLAGHSSQRTRKKITDKGTISLVVERAKIMGTAILAPEVVLGWAAEQFMVAWRVRHGGYLV